MKHIKKFLVGLLSWFTKPKEIDYRKEWRDDYDNFLKENPGEWTDEKCNKMFKFMGNPRPGNYRFLSWSECHPCIKDKPVVIETISDTPYLEDEDIKKYFNYKGLKK